MKKSKFNFSTVGKKAALTLAASLVLQQPLTAQNLTENKLNKHSLSETVTHFSEYDYNNIWDSKLTTLELHEFNRKKTDLVHILNRKDRQNDNIVTAYATYREDYFEKNIKQKTNKNTADEFINFYKDKKVPTNLINEYLTLQNISNIESFLKSIKQTRHGTKSNAEAEWKKTNIRKAIRNSQATSLALEKFEIEIMSSFTDKNTAKKFYDELTKLKQIIANNQNKKHIEILTPLHKQIEVVADLLSKEKKYGTPDMCSGLISLLVSEHQMNMLVSKDKIKYTQETNQIEDILSK
ncbi:MAG: hypothetical protein IKT33_02440 [Clostridia bacterium]|nr:hypothetical protein [Clostridia bacterium]